MNRAGPGRTGRAGPISWEFVSTDLQQQQQQQQSVSWTSDHRAPCRTSAVCIHATMRASPSVCQADDRSTSDDGMTALGRSGPHAQYADNLHLAADR